jgi:hypothetical protein
MCTKVFHYVISRKSSSLLLRWEFLFSICYPSREAIEMERPDESFVRHVVHATVPYLSATSTFRRTSAVCLGLFPVIFAGTFVWTAWPAPFRGIAAFSSILLYKWSLDYFRRTWICSHWVPWLAHPDAPLQ